MRLAIALWALAGALLLLLPFPGLLAALLAIPYVVLAWPYRAVSDAASGAANRAWRRFLAVNYAVGFVATMILIAVASGVGAGGRGIL